MSNTQQDTVCVPRDILARIRHHAEVALECTKSARTQRDTPRYIKRVIDSIDIETSLNPALAASPAPVREDARPAFVVDEAAVERAAEAAYLIGTNKAYSRDWPWPPGEPYKKYWLDIARAALHAAFQHGDK